MTVTGTATPRLRRRPGDGIALGVAAAIADHLGVRREIVRVAFVALAFAGGLGLALYGVYYVVLPIDPVPGHGRPHRIVEYVLAAVVAIVCVVVLLHTVPRAGLVVPIGLGALGAALIWRQSSGPERSRLAALTRSSLESTHDDRLGRVRVVAGVVLVVVGAGIVLGRSDVSTAGDALGAAVVVVVGIALVTGPWWMRMATALRSEREERIRSQERADLAARVHDSVLQTLALIQRSADSPREVVRLARGQERELRSLLYDTPADTGRFGDRMRDITAEVEDAYGVTVEFVAVGDADLDAPRAAVAAAAREALVNAAKHAGVTTVSLYVEVADDETSVFVRDRGRGFDPDAVPDDRQGIRRSIRQRVEHAGGRVELRTSPGTGTEVGIHLPGGTP
ncbi:ATP-binding protein [Jatrophihabitans endophyticus]|uniref:ATP-binding protein n=1 Tax=Jatrophihabitans endophyticus TaxID=1206085 RepID=UPI001A0E79EE|nr:ATP-binding protein [Jatrophihabitans endophyticus]MBE7190056.1 PspC domain-containing protein [Jatrophihabitans endophyticus]